jgi:hypothetical protein
MRPGEQGDLAEIDHSRPTRAPGGAPAESVLTILSPSTTISPGERTSPASTSIQRSARRTTASVTAPVW